MATPTFDRSTVGYVVVDRVNQRPMIQKDAHDAEYIPLWHRSDVAESWAKEWGGLVVPGHLAIGRLSITPITGQRVE